MLTYDVKSPIYVRQCGDAEQKAMEAGLRSLNAFLLRRSQILLASIGGEGVPAISPHGELRRTDGMQRYSCFQREGAGCASRRHPTPANYPNVFFEEQVEELIAILHRKTRTFGKPTSLWTLDLLE